MSEYELERAFQFWLVRSKGAHLEDVLKPFLKVKKQTNWLKSSREAQDLTTLAVAKRLQIAQQTYSKYEFTEQNGSITMGALSRAAEAMDCELVYAIRPRSGSTFARLMWNEILPLALKHPWLKACDSRRKSEALAFLVGRMTPTFDVPP